MSRVRSFLREDRGEDLIEYGLLLAFAAALVTVLLMNDSVSVKAALITAFDRVKTAFTLIH